MLDGTTRWKLLIGAATCVVACSSPRGRSAVSDPPTTSGTPSTKTEPGNDPTSIPTGGPVTSIGLDPRAICSKDDDCQIIHACDCQRCIPSKRMDVEACSESCKTDACAGHRASCDHGQCSAGDPHTHTVTKEWIDEATKVGQLVLDDPRVALYFHEKQRPERVPLVVAWPHGAATPAWTKFGKPVVFATDAIPPRETPHLFLAELTIEQGTSAHMSFGYGAEGLSVYAVLTKKQGAWTISELHVSENSSVE